MRHSFFAVVFIVLSVFSHNTCQAFADEKVSPLAALIAFEKELNEKYDPFANPQPGKNNRQLVDYSAESLLQQFEDERAFLKKLDDLPLSTLTEAEKIDHAILKYRVKNRVDNYLNFDRYMPLTAESGFHVDISFLPQQIKFSTWQDYDDYLARLTQIPALFEQQINWMKQGLNSGITQPQAVLVGFEQSIIAFVKSSPEDSEYYQPFNQLPDHLDASQQLVLRQRAKQIISDAVFPAYQAFYNFMTTDYMPNARQSLAASALPDGERIYQNRVAYYTTTDLTAEAIHQLGLSEVARIKAEMAAVIAQVGFDGSFAEFVAFLRQDPQFYAKTADQLLKEAAYIAKKIDAKLPAFFATLPRKPYGVEPVPASIAPKYTTGRYKDASRDDEAGYYWVNTYALDRRPLYVLEALTLHEAVPGHHLQISLAKEQTDVAEFRRNTYISAFGEGWALYAEKLGIEMGLYQDPYSQFGRLTYEMWRACRLVVDTGIHLKGWSRQQAIDYLAGNTALSLHNVTTEIDRYISWPAQALSYKMGEIKIVELKQKAQLALGQHFDIREFHDQILKQGSVPLSILEQLIDNYIAKKQQQIMENKKKGRQQS